MKKKLVSLFAALIAISAPAWAQNQLTKANTTAALGQHRPAATQAIAGTRMEVGSKADVEPDSRILDPQGERKLYSMSFTINDDAGAYSYSSDKMQVCFDADGKTVYFKDFVRPYNDWDRSGHEAWVKGTIDGDKITIPGHQMIWRCDTTAYYLEGVGRGDDGMVRLDQFQLKLNADGSMTYLIDDNSTYMGVYEPGVGFWAFSWDYTLKPVTDTPVTLPEGLQTTKNVLDFIDGYDGEIMRFVYTAQDGEDFYISGLAPSTKTDWVKGKINGDKVEIPSWQLLASDEYTLYTIAAADLTGYDDYGNPKFEPCDMIELKMTNNGSVLTLTPSNKYLLELYYDRTGYTCSMYSLSTTVYDGDEPATPADPLWISYGHNGSADVSDDDPITWKSFTFLIPTTDTEGHYINPEKLAYRVLVDGEPYTFNPDAYKGLPESTTEIPFYFSNLDNIIYVEGNYEGLKTVYFRSDLDNLENRVFIQSVYTVDGEARYSGLVSEETAAVQPNRTHEAKLVSTSYYDLFGRAVSMPSRNGVYVKADVYADGTRKVSKIVYRE